MMLHATNSRSFSVLLCIILSFNLINSMFHVLNAEFDHDEFQHMHIAWNILAGKVVYRDFFDHHGPLFSMLNGFFLRLLGIEASVSTLFYLRATSLLYMSLTLYLTFRIASEALESRQAGLLSAAILSGLLVFQLKSTEFRPDVLQSVLWLSGLYVVLMDSGGGWRSRLFLAGILFGGVVMTTMKGVVGVASVILYYLVVCLRGVQECGQCTRNILSLISGMLVVFLLLCIYFLSYGALSEFIYYNTWFNLHAFMNHNNDNFSSIMLFLMETQPLFVAAGLGGLLMLGWGLIIPGSRGPGYSRRLLLFTSSLVAVFSAPLGLYPQHYLLILPLLSVTSAYAFLWLKQALEDVNSTGFLYVFSLFFFFASMIFASVSYTPYAPSDILISQVELTEFILRNTSRDEPVPLLVWNNCGGFVFNEDIQYYWSSSMDMEDVFEMDEGYDVFGEHLTRLMGEKKVRYVLSEDVDTSRYDQWYVGHIIYRGTPPETRRYVAENFHQGENPCLWIRNNA
ncbi:MAG: glycosyltransferase family 39 protein [Candidatus Altiarchaeota archaeon]